MILVIRNGLPNFIKTPTLKRPLLFVQRIKPKQKPLKTTRREIHYLYHNNLMGNFAILL